MTRLEALWKSLCPSCKTKSWKTENRIYQEELVKIWVCRTCEYVTEATRYKLQWQADRLRDAHRGWRLSSNPREEPSRWLQSIEAGKVS